MREFVDQLGNRFQLDTSLDVVVDGHLGYIEGNAHTSPGRIHIYFPHLGHDLTRSVSDIDSMSDTARTWITGFLTGCEPSVYEYLGIEGSGLEPTDAEYDRWRDFTARFRQAGDCPVLRKRPQAALVITSDEQDLLRAPGGLRPWAQAGERVWVPDAFGWVEAVPQPQLVNGQMPGSVCAQRGYPDLLQLDSGWAICLDCCEVRPPDA